MLHGAGAASRQHRCWRARRAAQDRPAYASSTRSRHRQRERRSDRRQLPRARDGHKRGAWSRAASAARFALRDSQGGSCGRTHSSAGPQHHKSRASAVNPSGTGRTPRLCRSGVVEQCTFVLAVRTKALRRLTEVRVRDPVQLEAIGGVGGGGQYESTLLYYTGDPRFA
jgi:hypothetical protein